MLGNIVALLLALVIIFGYLGPYQHYKQLKERKEVIMNDYQKAVEDAKQDNLLLFLDLKSGEYTMTRDYWQVQKLQNDGGYQQINYLQ